MENITKMTQLYTNQLQQLLMKEGISREDLPKILSIIDEQITGNISEEMIIALDEKQQEELEHMQSNNATPEQIATFLHITEEDFVKRYTEKLELYTNNLSHNLPALKKYLST